MKYIFFIFLCISILHFLILFHLPPFVPEAMFPYKDLLHKYFSFYPFTPFANFDGYQYISISRIGYTELQQSFFPLYPLLIYLVSFVFVKQYIFSGVLISWLCLFFGLYYFYKLAGLLLHKNKQALWAVLLLSAFPTAFFYQMVYTESLYLLLSAAGLYYLFTKKYVWAAVIAIFASLTKTQGVLLLLPFLLIIIDWQAVRKNFLVYVRTSWLHILLALGPLYGLFLYCGYLYIRYKDPLYFYHAQSAFHLQRSVGSVVLFPQVMYRYLKIFFLTPLSFIYWISVLEFAVFMVFLAVFVYELFRLYKQKKRDWSQVALQLYSLAVLIFPTLTGTFVSVPRFALISFGFFIILAKIRISAIKYILFICFLLLQIVLYICFLRGYFVS